MKLRPIGLIVLCSSAALAIAYTAQAQAAKPPRPPAAQVASTTPPAATFHDAANRLVMAFNFDPTQRAEGDYALTIYGVGNVSGTLPLLRTTSSTGLIDADRVAAKCTPIGASKPAPCTLSMDGAVDLGHSAAALFFTVLGQSYLLIDYLPSASTAPARALAIGAAIQAQSWSSIYSMLSSEQQQSVSRAQFVASLTSQTGPAIAQIQLGGSGTSDNRGGALYWHQPITITATPTGGVSQKYTATMDLVAEGGQWRFLDTTNPTHS